MSELSQALESMPITAECKFLRFEPAPAGHESVRYQNGTYHWSITIRYKGNAITGAYSTGTGHCAEPSLHKNSTLAAKLGFGYGPIKDWRTSRTIAGTAFRNAWLASPESANPPSLADVLGCWLSCSSGAEQSFEDWCSDFGYDTDSRKAYAIWQEERTTQLNLRVLFGSDYDRLVGL